MNEYQKQFRQTQGDAWWSLPRIFAAAVVGIVLLYCIGFVATGGDLVIYSFWAPKQADAQRNVFEHSQSYVEGKITNIGQLCRESARAEGMQKKAIDNEILNEASTIRESVLPASEQACIASAKGL